MNADSNSESARTLGRGDEVHWPRVADPGVACSCKWKVQGVSFAEAQRRWWQHATSPATTYLLTTPHDGHEADALAEHLQGTWPHLFNDGFQNEVAVEAITFLREREDS